PACVPSVLLPSTGRHRDLLSFPTRRSSDLDFSRIGDGDFGPVFDAALAAHMAQIEAIAANPERPTIDNTLKALELSGQELDRVSDRKSTRLNSSHVKISYAVFCLKEKSTRR